MFLQLILKYLFKFFQFGSYYDGAIRVGVFIIHVVILVIIFCRVKNVKLCYLRYNRIRKSTAFIQFGFIFLRFLFLFIVMVKDYTALLCFYISALPVERGRVMYLPENFQQFVICNRCGIVYHLYAFSVAGFACTYFLVSRVGFLAAAIAGCSGNNAV